MPGLIRREMYVVLEGNLQREMKMEELTISC